MNTIRWGILGCGSIASKFAAGLQVAEHCVAYACAARSLDKAVDFSVSNKVNHAIEGYDALYQHPEVDAIYIATPHVFHYEQTRAALLAGKAVLCEKPLCVNASQALELRAIANEKQLLLMEAMWTRFLPIMVKARELISQGAIGHPRMIEADFGFRFGGGPDHRLVNPDLAGGSLLDVGIYPLSLMQSCFGSPESITGVAHLGQTGVDEQAAFTLKFSAGAIGIGHSAVRTQTRQTATIYGDEGMLHIPSPWWCGQRVVLSSGGNEESFDFPHKANGYEYEAEAFAQDLKAGRIENNVMPLNDSLVLQEIMDELRNQWGLNYPWE